MKQQYSIEQIKEAETAHVNYLATDRKLSSYFNTKESPMTFTDFLENYARNKNWFTPISQDTTEVEELKENENGDVRYEKLNTLIRSHKNLLQRVQELEKSQRANTLLGGDDAK